MRTGSTSSSTTISRVRGHWEGPDRHWAPFIPHSFWPPFAVLWVWSCNTEMSSGQCNFLPPQGRFIFFETEISAIEISFSISACGITVSFLFGQGFLSDWFDCFLRVSLSHVSLCVWFPGPFLERLILLWVQICCDCRRHKHKFSWLALLNRVLSFKLPKSWTWYYLYMYVYAYYFFSGLINFYKILYFY